jgi:hypothetical protein
VVLVCTLSIWSSLVQAARSYGPSFAYSGTTKASRPHPTAATALYVSKGENMIELKVRKFGNSLGVVLPKEVVNRLQTSDG